MKKKGKNMIQIEDSNNNSSKGEEVEGLEDLLMSNIKDSIMKTIIQMRIKKVKEWKKINTNIETSIKLLLIMKNFRKEILILGTLILLKLLLYILINIFLKIRGLGEEGFLNTLKNAPELIIAT